MNLKSKVRRLLAVFLASFLSVADIRRMLQFKLDREEKSFAFNSQRLDYFFHSHNNFRLTERSVEIPIIKHFLEQKDYQNVLEIGNVTNHYYTFFRLAFKGKRRTVIDKYEVAYDVINLDICDFAPNLKFDFVFSVSTFEHMDSDLGRNPDYVAGSSRLVSVAADNIRHVSDVLLEDGGKFVITAALGYTPEWDATFYSNAFEECGFSRYRTYILRKKTELVWRQVDIEEGRHATYGHPLPGVNYLSIVEFDK